MEYWSDLRVHLHRKIPLCPNNRPPPPPPPPPPCASSCSVALFTVNFSHLHYNVLERGCEAISGKTCTIARNCLTFTFKYIVMQMKNETVKRAISRDLSYCARPVSRRRFVSCPTPLKGSEFLLCITFFIGSNLVRSTSSIALRLFCCLKSLFSGSIFLIKMCDLSL